MEHGCQSVRWARRGAPCYVQEAFRRQGVGRHLLEGIVAAARGAFDELHLRTDSAEAARFYERFGFRRVNYEAATHALTLGSRRGRLTT